MYSEIECIDVYLLNCKMKDKIGNASRFFDKREALVIKITTKGGEIGWGETWAMPGPAAALIQNVLAPELIGEDATFPLKLWRKLSKFIINDRRGLTHMAISALDIATWDVSSRMADKSLSQHLGGALRNNLTTYISGPFLKPGPNPYEHYPEEIINYKEKGYNNIKIRAGRDAIMDSNLIGNIRKIIGPNIGLMVDFNESSNLNQTLEFEKRISDYNLIWLEEPIVHDDLPNWKKLSNLTSLSLAGGESLYGLSGFRDYFTSGIFSIAQPDLALCGGISEAIRIAAMAEAFNVPIAPHVWGTAINFNASLHFASVLPDRTNSNLRIPFFEIDASYNPLRSEFVELILEKDGSIKVPTGKGLGLIINEKDLKPFLVNHTQIRA